MPGWELQQWHLMHTLFPILSDMLGRDFEQLYHLCIRTVPVERGLCYDGCEWGLSGFEFDCR